MRVSARYWNIVQNMIAATATQCMCEPSDDRQQTGNGTLYTGVGLYVHIRSRKRLHGCGNKGEPTKEAAAQAGRAADNCHCSPAPFPIAQSQMPQGGLFEPVGCPPRLSTPGGFSQSSFMHSITSSSKSGSFMAGKLTPYPAAMLGANKTAMHQLRSGHEAQQAQQQHAASSTDLIRSGVAQHAQHAQRDAVDTQHAEEALSLEAAAAEAALGSFSRASSQTALQSCHTTAAFPLPANAPTDADAQEAAHQAAPSSAQRPFHLDLASQQGGRDTPEPDQQMMSQSGKGLRVSQGSKGGQPGVLPLQGYPAGETATGAGGLQLTAPRGPSLTQAQVNTLHLTFK